MATPATPPSTYELARALARRRATGRLHVRTPSGPLALVFIEGRLVWATGRATRAALGPALVASGLLDEATRQRLEDVAADDDGLIDAAADVVPRAQLEAVRREVVRARVRLALGDGEEARFEQASGALAGLDPGLLPDLDLAGLGQAARRDAEAARFAGPPAGTPLGRATHVLLERFHARHVDTWYDLLGERPSASMPSLSRAAESRLAEWRAVADNPGADAQLRWRADVMCKAVELAHTRLSIEADRDAYDQLVRRGGAPRVADLIAELEPEAPANFAPAADTPEAPAPKPEKRGLLARLFGGAG
jgi:hypothetical protein